AEVRPATAGAPDAGEIRMIGLGEPPMLSELMPALRNFGIEVIAEDAHELHPAAGGKIARAYVQAFSVRGADGRAFSELPGVALLADALLAVRAGTAEDDPLNALTPAAGLAWRETALLRAYLAAAFQMRLAPSREALRRALLLYPELARKLFESFAARLSPDLETPADEIAALRAACTDRIAAIDNIGDDRNARALLSMVEATVRTNYFCKPPTPDSCIALKFESGRIAALPGIPPLYEIHVNSPRMEGCHLRAGKIARGGIRFSDRHDDYRVEILDLMKTQTVKNAIIVPTGAKGGFIVKPRRGGVRDPDPAVSAYRTLIGALLDLTDNLSAAGAAHPAGVKALDDDGAYLVVAADKGTAAFSDAANRIAIERGFWLGDAFASGGEHGYDHKKMGITARGAWESARRHLREMGRDPDRGAPITTIGIADMSGDVFGNGLLQSRNVKLVAAFDHRHIFIDPDPDPAASFAERKRLFAMARSSWADYNPALIGRGGGVFRRGEKRIELSEPARAALGCEARALDGESLIAAILRAPADLLYNGGIGTYVRASDESNADADDRANDACRIAAAELRVKAVVEGGNLGFTQRARIEYALAGGRIDTDAIDNSAGVDLSDHEVNLKILLQQPMARGEMSFAERNALLTGCAEEVARGVIADNRDQALWLSLEQVRSRSQMAAFREHLRALESHRLPISDQAALPNRELLRERHARYPGLTRPELAAIGAYTKIDLSARLAAAPFIADPYLADRFLKPYFPAAIAERFGADIERHRLRRELIATRIANELVDLAGATFVFGLTRDFGGDAETAVRAWITGADLLSIRGRAAQIKSKEANAAAPQAELDACFALERASRGAARWALDRLDPAAPIAAAIARYRPGFDALFGTFEPMLAQGERDRFEAAQRELRRAGVDGELAHDLARLAFAEQLLEILDLAVSDRTDLERAAAAYFRLGGEIDFSRLEAALEAIAAGEDRWERRAAIELGAELRAARIAMCRALIERATDGLDAGIERLRRERETRFAEAVSLCAEMRTGAPPGIPALQVTIRSVSRLASGN
ncbi:MAG: NAD-glutamate dehydrogenase domain-containing protein, partial [Candidatus Binataceae bacterium]